MPPSSWGKVRALKQIRAVLLTTVSSNTVGLDEITAVTQSRQRMPATRTDPGVARATARSIQRYGEIPFFRLTKTDYQSSTA